MSLETLSGDFAGDIPAVPEKFEKKMFGFNFCWPLVYHKHQKVWVSIKFLSVKFGFAPPPPPRKRAQNEETVQISRKSSTLTLFRGGAGNAFYGQNDFYRQLGVSESINRNSSLQSLPNLKHKHPSKRLQEERTHTASQTCFWRTGTRIATLQSP